VSNVDCILNCDRESISLSLSDAEAYLHLPIVVRVKGYGFFFFFFLFIFLIFLILNVILLTLSLIGQMSKLDRFSLLSNLPSAVNFAKLNLSQGKTLFVCCHDGKD
jgi:tRNA A64-2'-O-ribosylphosphate transferase